MMKALGKKPPEDERETDCEFDYEERADHFRTALLEASGAVAFWANEFESDKLLEIAEKMQISAGKDD